MASLPVDKQTIQNVECCDIGVESEWPLVNAHIFWAFPFGGSVRPIAIPVRDFAKARAWAGQNWVGLGTTLDRSGFPAPRALGHQILRQRTVELFHELAALSLVARL